MKKWWIALLVLVIALVGITVMVSCSGGDNKDNGDDDNDDSDDNDDDDDEGANDCGKECFINANANSDACFEYCFTTPLSICELLFCETDCLWTWNTELVQCLSENGCCGKSQAQCEFYTCIGDCVKQSELCLGPDCVNSKECLDIRNDCIMECGDEPVTAYF